MAQSNYSALHSTPVYLNQMNSGILRMLSGDADLSIKTVMHPFPGEVLLCYYCEACAATLTTTLVRRTNNDEHVPLYA